MPDLSKTFIDALGRLETARDVETIASLFADNAEVSNPLVTYQDGGADAAKTFWSQYRDAFDEIRSEFRTVTEKDGLSFLEWTSKGSIDGKGFDYEGVSILEGDGDRITSFRTYFDTRHLPTARTRGGEGTGRVEASGEGNGKSDGGKDDMVEAQRDAAEQRAAGGYS
ncbi:nuclear transport factor 2 family protein [Rhizobium sp. NTR19]|uniref:Nuclear transport factor 2 family protein n=1 Tax=Neorhizobium turbinariae TaxID=2937795 RepID=A0ABT0ILJ8_9HYPH|nr:nuclear transport factor 2 family protein [Neorhizobium turbinariae]MCK8778763.1 nuclear transport factor 2 family protein [Neorhizobium turbinariae]